MPRSGLVGRRENHIGTQADDSTFLRRVYLDLVGAIPYEEARQFSTSDAKARQADQRLLIRVTRSTKRPFGIILFGRNPPNSDATRNRARSYSGSPTSLPGTSLRCRVRDAASRTARKF
jgi:hypothetical protein